MKTSTRRITLKQGTTVVDLVTIAATLAIGISLAFPFLQQCRESARGKVCEQRLALIAIDSFMYHDVYERLPMQLGAPGVTPWENWIGIASGQDRKKPTIQSRNFTTLGEEYYLYQQNTSPIALASSVTTEYSIDPIAFDFEENLFDKSKWFFEMEGWQELAFQQPERFLCPTASKILETDSTFGTTLAIQPVSLNGTGDECDGELGVLFDQDSYGISNYVGCVGAGAGGQGPDGLCDSGDAIQYRGIIASRERVTLDELEKADGASNTLMFGENIGEIRGSRSGIGVEYKTSWLNGGLAMGRGNADWMTSSSPGAPLLGHAMNSSTRGFGSFHRDGVNFVRGDGSVTMLNRDIDMRAYYALCGGFDTQLP